MAGSSSRIMAPIVSVAAASASSDWRQLLSVWSRLHIREATLRGIPPSLRTVGGAERHPVARARSAPSSDHGVTTQWPHRDNAHADVPAHTGLVATD